MLCKGQGMGTFKVNGPHLFENMKSKKGFGKHDVVCQT